MADALIRANAILAVEEARRNLIDKIEFARGHGVGESELMQVLNMSQYALARFRVRD